MFEVISVPRKMALIKARLLNHDLPVHRKTATPKLPEKKNSKNAKKFQQLRFGVFCEGVFQKMPALEGQFLKEISVRFAGENHLRTQKNTKQSSAQRFLNDPFPKTPFFSC